MIQHITRRRFLERAFATSAACGLARPTSAADVGATPAIATDSIIDTHVYLDHWPHRRISGDEPSDLVASLRRNHVSQAWAGSFDGLLHKDIGAVNQRLADTCAQLGNGFFIPIGTVNPTLPDWEEDIRRCHEMFHMPGVRLHPNYHGYALDDPRFARLLDLTASRGIVVQLVAWMEDESHKWLSPRTTHVDLTPLAKVVADRPKLRLVVANGFRGINDESFRSLAPLRQVYFDVSRVDDDVQARKLFAQVSAQRLLIGSTAPLRYVETARAKLNVRLLKDAQSRAIASGTAARLVAGP